MTLTTGTQLQPLLQPLPLVQEPVVESNCLDNLAGSVFYGLHADIQVKLCKTILTWPAERMDAIGSTSLFSRLFRRMSAFQSHAHARFFDDQDKVSKNTCIRPFENLSSFFRTCRAMNTVWRKNFLSGCGGDLDEDVQRLTEQQVRTMVAKICGSEIPPPRVIDKLGALTVNPWLVSAPRLLCTQLTLSPSGPWPWSDLWGTQGRLQSTISAYPPFLDALKIVYAEMTDALLDEVARKCSQLTKLHLVCCYGISFSGTAVWESLTSLTSFDCRDLRHDRCLKNIARCFPKLTRLSMEWLGPIDQTGITGAGLRALASGCTCLTSLQLDSCYGVDGAALFALAEQCPSLTRIFLEGCALPSIHDCVLLLCAFGGISDLIIQRRDRWKGLVSSGTHASIEEHLDRSCPQQIVDLAWACAVFGLDDRILMGELIWRARKMLAYLGDAEIAKMHWVCARFDKMSDERLFVPIDREAALSAQDSPEKRDAARKKATELLMEFLGEVRAWV